VKEYYDRVVVVFINDEGIFGTIDKLGAFASNVKYKKNGEECEVILENEDFVIVDEIVFEHVEEEN
jgi:hypothetical protein